MSLYSTEPDSDCAFLSDVLKLSHVTLPGGGKLGVYQPRHARPKPMPKAAKAGGGKRSKKKTAKQ